MSADDGDESDDCCVCGVPDWSDDNVFIYCDLCGTATHQLCYDVDTVPSGDWYCLPCKFITASYDSYVKAFPDKPPFPIYLPCCVMCQSASTAVIDLSHQSYDAKSSPKYTYKAPAGATVSSSRSSWWKGEDNPVVNNTQMSAPRVPNLFSLQSPLQLAGMQKLHTRRDIDQKYPEVLSSAWNSVRPAKLSKALYPPSEGSSIISFFSDASFKRIIDFLSTNVQLSRFKQICQPTPANWGLTLGSLVPQYASRGDVKDLTQHFSPAESTLLQNTLTNLPCWAHSACSIWVPGQTLEDGFSTGISNVEHDRRRLVCSVCNTRGGAVQCDWSNCLTAFHPYCGVKGGLQVCMETSGKSFKYTYRCHAHRTDEFNVQKKDQYLSYWADPKKAAILNNGKKKARPKSRFANSSSDDEKTSSKRRNMVVTPSPHIGYSEFTPQTSVTVEAPPTPQLSEHEDSIKSASVSVVPAVIPSASSSSLSLPAPRPQPAPIDQNVNTQIAVTNTNNSFDIPLTTNNTATGDDDMIMQLNDKEPIAVVNETGHFGDRKSLKLTLHDQDELSLKMLLEYSDVRYDYGDQRSRVNLSRYFLTATNPIDDTPKTDLKATLLSGKDCKVRFSAKGQVFPASGNIQEYNENLPKYRSFLKEEWKDEQSKFHYDVYSESAPVKTAATVFKKKDGLSIANMRAQVSKVGLSAHQRFGCGLRMLGSKRDKFMWRSVMYKRRYSVDSVSLIPESATHGVRLRLHGFKRIVPPRSGAEESGAETSELESYFEAFDSDFAEFSEGEGYTVPTAPEEDIWRDGLELFVLGQNEDTTVLDPEEEKRVLRECFVSTTNDLNLLNPPTEERDDVDFSETITSEKQLWPRVGHDFFHCDSSLREALSAVQQLRKNLSVDTHLLDVMLEAPKRGRPIRRQYVSEVFSAAVKRFSLFLEINGKDLSVSSQQSTSSTMKRTKKTEQVAPEGILTRLLPPVHDEPVSDELVYHTELAQRAWSYRSPYTEPGNPWKVDRLIVRENAAHSNIPVSTPNCWDLPQFTPGVFIGHQNRLFPVYTRCHHANPQFTGIRASAQSMYGSCRQCQQEKLTLRAFRQLVDAAQVVRQPLGFHVTSSCVASTPSSKFLILTVHSLATSSMLGSFYTSLKRKHDAVPFTLTSNNEPAVGFTAGSMVTPRSSCLVEFDDLTCTGEYTGVVKKLVRSSGVAGYVGDRHQDQLVLYDDYDNSVANKHNLEEKEEDKIPVIDPIELEILSLQSQLQASRRYVKRVFEKLEGIIEERENDFEAVQQKAQNDEQALRQYRKERAMWRAAAAIEKRRLQSENSNTDDSLSSLPAEAQVAADVNEIPPIDVHPSVLEKRMERADAHRSTLVPLSTKLRRCNVCNAGGMTVYQYQSKFWAQAKNHVQASQRADRPTLVVAVAMEQLPKALLPFRLVLGSNKRPASFQLFSSASMTSVEDSSNNYNMELWGQQCLFIGQLQAFSGSTGQTMEVLPYEEDIFSYLKNGPVVSCTVCSVSVHANCYDVEEPLWCPNIVTFSEALSVFYALQLRKLAHTNKNFDSIVDSLQGYSEVSPNTNIFELQYMNQSGTMFIHADALVHAFTETMSLLQGEGVFQHRFKYNTAEENTWEARTGHFLGCPRKLDPSSNVPAIGIEAILRQECAFSCAWRRDDQVHALLRVKEVLSAAMFTSILCNYCELVSDANTDDSLELPTSNVCVCCHVSGGAQRLTEENQVVHASCATLLPELFYSGDLIAGVDECLKTRKSLTCYLCNQKIGACVQCNHKLCYAAFHVTCGYQAGLTVSKETEGATTKTTMFCDKHSTGKPRVQRFITGDLQRRRKGIRSGYYPLPSLYTNTSTLSIMSNLVSPNVDVLTIAANNVSSGVEGGLFKRRGRPPKGGYAAVAATAAVGGTESSRPSLTGTPHKPKQANLKADGSVVKKRGRPPRVHPIGALGSVSIGSDNSMSNIDKLVKPLPIVSMSNVVIDKFADKAGEPEKKKEKSFDKAAMDKSADKVTNTKTTDNASGQTMGKNNAWSIRGILDFFRPNESTKPGETAKSTENKTNKDKHPTPPPKKRKVLDSDDENEVVKKKSNKPTKTASFDISNDVVVPLSTAKRVYTAIDAIDYDDRAACYCHGNYNDSVECSGCLMWFHYPCAGIIDQELIDQVENDAWKCSLCLTGTFYKKQHRQFVEQLLDEDFSTSR